MSLAIVGPVGIRRFTVEKACEAHEGHAHNYDHTTVVVRGRLRVSYSYDKDGKPVEGETREYGQGEAVVIRAGVRHTVKALEDDTQYLCVFSHRDFGGLVSQSYVGNQRAYV